MTTTHRESADVLVIGSGLAGLTVSLAAAPRSVLLATKGVLPSGSSPYAQGGIAAAVGPSDSPRLHADDTLHAARGLADPAAVEALTASGPDAIERLVELGVSFDRDEDGALSLGREGGHGKNRIVRAGGDATGSAVVSSLVDAVRSAAHVRTLEGVFIVDLIHRDGRVVGAVGLDEHGERIALFARDVVLATGGLGHAYRFTTNPPEVTGDGMAMAARAGAALANMEFVQFHPTTLATDTSLAPLLTEALRGAGAWLIDEDGRRFLFDVDPAGELAPRDVVAREVFRRRAWLDVRPLGETLARRFPTLIETCRRAGLDPSREPLPVTPAAHYAMGGVEVDRAGRTSLPGLWACGETACTGVHGANRLASNSLLEALVFGFELGRHLAAGPGSPVRAFALPVGDGAFAQRAGDGACDVDPAAARDGIRRVMWSHVGLVRDASGLSHALGALRRWEYELDARPVRTREHGEARNLALVGALVTRAALERKQSRGSHFRADQVPVGVTS